MEFSFGNQQIHSTTMYLVPTMGKTLGIEVYPNTSKALLWLQEY